MSRVGRARKPGSSARWTACIAAAAVACCMWPSPVAAQSASPNCKPLLVTRAVIDHVPLRYWQDEPRSRVRIRGRFRSTPDLLDVRAKKGALELRLGDHLLAYDDDPYWEKKAIKRRGTDLRFVTQRYDDDDPARRRLVVDLARGRFRASVRRQDLHSFRTGGVKEVLVVLRVGTRMYQQRIALDTSRSKSRYRAPRKRDPPAAPAPIHTGESRDVQFRQLTRQDSRPTSSPGVSVVRSQEALDSAWSWRSWEGYRSLFPVPTVEFDTNLVIFIDAGNRRATGPGLRIAGVRTTACGIHVEIRESRGGATAESQPWTALEIPRMDVGVITWTHKME